MKQPVLFFLLLITSSLLIGCSKAESYDYAQRTDFFQPDVRYQAEMDSENAADLTDPSMTEFFQSLYGMEHLKSQAVLWDGTVFQMDFNFSQDVSLSEIDGARSFVLNKFVLRLHNRYSVSSYETWMRQDGELIKLPAVTCRILCEDTLLFQDNYKDTQLAGCYENTDLVLPCRKAKEDWTELEAFVHKNAPNSTVHVQKAIKDGSVLILLDLKEKPSLSFIDKLEEFLIEKVRNEASEKPFMVLSIAQEMEPVFSSVLDLNSHSLDWSDQDWTNHKQP